MVILFGSVDKVLAFQPGVQGLNPTQTLYFCYVFVHLSFVMDFVR